jgi:hypothetical protein
MVKKITYFIMYFARLTSPGWLLSFKNLFLFFIISLNFSSLTCCSQMNAIGECSLGIVAIVKDRAALRLETLYNICIDYRPGDEDEIYISPVASSNAGLMRAYGTPGSQVRMTYLPTDVLSEENGNGTIAVYYEMSGNKRWLQESSKLTDTGEAVFNLGSDGAYYLWVGGLINVTKAGAGQYRGRFTLEIEYL